MREINIPISAESIRELKVGEPVQLNGVMVTGRDSAHKWLVETFIKKTRAPQGSDLQAYAELKKYLDGGVIYHCGPVVSGLESGDYRFVAAGPTTSIREEPYQADVMKHFNVKGVIGKGPASLARAAGAGKVGWLRRFRGARRYRLRRKALY